MLDPHHVYLDLDVIINNHTPGVSPPYLRFAEIRSTPFWTATARNTSVALCDSQFKPAIPSQWSYLSWLFRTIRRYPSSVLTLRLINWRIT